MGKTFLRMSSTVTCIMARVFAYLPSFFSQILDLIYWTVLIFLFWSILNGVTLKTSNLRLKYPTCRAYFERLLSYVFNQINNFITGFDRNRSPKKNKNPRLRDLTAKNSKIRDATKHKKTRLRDSFKTPPKFRDWNKNFPDPESFRVPTFYFGSSPVPKNAKLHVLSFGLS